MKVSVVLPFYNREETLESSMRSVLDQTYEDLELNLIDDCSTDHSLEIALGLQQTDSRVKVSSTSSRLGAAGARNLGISVAKGRFLAFQDSDDLWRPNKLERQLQYLEEVKASGFSPVIVGCGWQLSGEDSDPTKFSGQMKCSRMSVLAGCVRGIGTPMLLLDRQNAIPSKFDTDFPSLEERDFVLSSIGSSGSISVCPEILVEVNRGRTDHVANPQAALKAINFYLRKYQSEISSQMPLLAWYHYRALLEAIKSRNTNQLHLHSRELHRLGVSRARILKTATRVSPKLALMIAVFLGELKTHIDFCQSLRTDPSIPAEFFEQ